MEEQHERENPVNPKEQLNSRREDSNRLVGAGATPSMGLSEYRGGGTKKGQTRKTARLAYMPSEPHQMGAHLGKHIMGLHGGAFHGDFLKGMESARMGDMARQPGRPALLSGRQHGKKTMREGAGMLDEPMPMPGTNLSLSGSGLFSSSAERVAKRKAMGAGRCGRIVGGAGTGAYEGQGRDSDIVRASKVLGRMKNRSVSPAKHEDAEALLALRAKSPPKSAPKAPARKQTLNPDSFRAFGDPMPSPHPHMSGRGRSARAQIVKKVMAEKGLKLIEASKYVKEHGLY
jgi:hypothetical protein